MDFFLVVFIIIVGGCWLISKLVGNAIFKEESEEIKKEEHIFNSKDTNYNQHVNNQQNINIYIVNDREKEKEDIIDITESSNRSK